MTPFLSIATMDLKLYGLIFDSTGVMRRSVPLYVLIRTGQVKQLKRLELMRAEEVMMQSEGRQSFGLKNKKKISGYQLGTAPKGLEEHWRQLKQMVAASSLW